MTGRACCSLPERKKPSTTTFGVDDDETERRKKKASSKGRCMRVVCMAVCASLCFFFLVCCFGERRPQRGAKNSRTRTTQKGSIFCFIFGGLRRRPFRTRRKPKPPTCARHFVGPCRGAREPESHPIHNPHGCINIKSIDRSIDAHSVHPAVVGCSIHHVMDDEGISTPSTNKAAATAATARRL